MGDSAEIRTEFNGQNITSITHFFESLPVDHLWSRSNFLNRDLLNDDPTPHKYHHDVDQIMLHDSYPIDRDASSIWLIQLTMMIPSFQVESSWHESCLNQLLDPHV